MGIKAGKNLVPAVSVPHLVDSCLCSWRFVCKAVFSKPNHYFLEFTGKSEKLFLCGESFRCWVHLEFFVSCIDFETWTIPVTDKKLLVLSCTVDFLNITAGCMQYLHLYSIIK